LLDAERYDHLGTDVSRVFLFGASLSVEPVMTRGLLANIPVLNVDTGLRIIRCDI
jgi:hypothetical protein